MMLCVWWMMDDCNVTSISFCCSWTFFFAPQMKQVFLLHMASLWLCSIREQVVKLLAVTVAHCAHIALCTYWNYQYFVEAYSAKVITFVSKIQLAICSSYGYFVIQGNVLLIISCEMFPDEFFEFCMKLYVFSFGLSQVSVIVYQ